MVELILAIFLVYSSGGEKIFIDITSPEYKPVKVVFDGDKEIKKLLERNIGKIGYFEVSGNKQDFDLIVKIGKTAEGYTFEGKFKDAPTLFKVEIKSHIKEAVANSFSNYIVEKVSGIKTDIFGKEVIFLSNLDGKKEIYSSVFPSAKVRKIVSAKSFIPFFSVSPNGEKIAYVHFDGKSYRIYIADRRTKKVYSPMAKTGMFLSPRFFTDNILTVAWNRGGGSSIYILDLKKRRMKRITWGNSDVLGEISPDGKKIVFVSGRGGLPQIYVKDFNGIPGERRLFLSGRYNTSPDISPDGKAIVFSKLEGNSFKIYVYDFEKDEERRITGDNMGSCENPTWTPDGNFIIFSSNRDGDYDLYITDKYGTFIRKIFDTNKDETYGVMVR